MPVIIPSGKRKREIPMTYRNTLIARWQHYASENEEPAVLDYLQLRNRHCLQAWHQRRIKYSLKVVAQEGRKPEVERTHA